MKKKFQKKKKKKKKKRRRVVHSEAHHVVMYTHILDDGFFTLIFCFTPSKKKMKSVEVRKYASC
jgi:hypothetical protein